MCHEIPHTLGGLRAVASTRAQGSSWSAGWVLSLSVLVLIACGEPTFPVVAGAPIVSTSPENAESVPEVRCAPCLKDVVAGPDDAPNCRIIAADVQMIVRLYETSGIASEARVCELLSDVILFVRPEKDGWEASPGWLAGGAYLDRQIIIVKNMVGFGHESLHAFEDLTGQMDSRDPHRGWDTKRGYATFLDSAARMACSQIESDNVAKPWCQ